jgi:hypothetical protein
VVNLWTHEVEDYRYADEAEQMALEQLERSHKMERDELLQRDAVARI